MKRPTTITCVTTMAILVSLGVQQHSAEGQGWQATEKTITVNQLERTYLVYTPRRAAGSLPLVLVLHGGGGTARQMERYTRFNRLADREQFLVCYPQGVKKNWNDGRGVDHIPAQRDNIDDVGFLREVVAAIGRDHELDQSRVFATD